MKIFFVRHGESVMNSTNSQQSVTTRLSVRGLRQAGIVANRLSAVKADAIISSNCTRAKQTARVIAKKFRKRIECTDLLNETKGSSELLGKTWDHEKVIEIRAERDRHLDDPYWHYSDEENYHDIKERAKRVIKYLSRRKGKELIVVTHGFILSVVVTTALFGEEISIKKLHKVSHMLRMDNTGITECEIGDDGSWKLITWNDHSHVK
jgi:broad specificity phosphatase PhoE